MRAITDFDGARDAALPMDRLREIRRRSAAFRERFMDEPIITGARSLDLLRVPYPSWYAFTGVYAQAVIKPLMVHLLTRMTVIRFLDFEGAPRTLLFGASDHERGRATPFFERLAQKTPSFLHGAMAPVHATVPQALTACGISPAEVDYLSFDHLHTQDLRRWLGDGGFFPNASLLVHRQEWASARALLPLQSDWYCPGGTDGIAASRVIAFDGSIQLGRGIALMHTPGHTEGNHSLVIRTPDGIRVSSENGVSADSWSPEQSRHNAIRRYATATGAEVILNGNTQESSVDQYLSMVQEKCIAGASTDHGFANCVPSSECTPHWLFLGAPASHLFGAWSFGSLQGASSPS
jgi:hypothetical protein